MRDPQNSQNQQGQVQGSLTVQTLDLKNLEMNTKQLKSSRDSKKLSLNADFSPKMYKEDMSEQDEDFFPFSLELLSQEKMYSNPQWQDYQEVANSEEVALSVIDSIIKKGGQDLYDKYLDTKMNDFVFKKTFFLSEFSWQPGRFIQDRGYAFNYQNQYLIENAEESTLLIKLDEIVEDQEPKLPGSESWRSFNIEVAQKQYLNKSIDQEIDFDAASKKSNLYSKKSILLKRNQRLLEVGSNLKRKTSVSSSIMSSPTAKKDEEAELLEKYNHYVFSEYKGDVVDLKGQNEIDRVEEQLRLIKERERELRQQKAEMDEMRLKEQKEQQQRMKQAQLGDSSKLFAFDYNGQVLGTNAVKMEKFPSQAVVCQHQISIAEQIHSVDDNTDAFKKKKKADGQVSSDLTSLKEVATSASTKQTKKQVPDIGQIQTTNSQAPINTISKQISVITTKAQTINSKGNQKEQIQNSINIKDQFFSPPQEIFEKFAVTKGVTLIESGRIKKGAAFQTNVRSIDVERLVDVDYAKQLSITKQEYNQLLPLPNQSRSTNKESVHSNLDKPLNDESIFGDKNHQSNIIPLEISEQKSQTQIMKGRKGSELSLSEKNKSQIINNTSIHSARYSKGASNNYFPPTSFRKSQQLKPIDTSKINIQSVNILQQLALDDQDYVFNVLDNNPLAVNSTTNLHNKNKSNYFSSSQLSSTLIKDKSEFISNEFPLSTRSSVEQGNDIRQSSSNIRAYNGLGIINGKKNNMLPITRPTDEFNQQIITQGNLWGSFDNQPPNSKKYQPLLFKPSEQFKEQCTIGLHGKLPKDRLMKKSKQFMSQMHLGSPKVGDTMGHGFVGDGFNPISLLNVKQYIENDMSYSIQD